MSREFRIVPRIGKAERTGTRWGFVIPDHPRGTPEAGPNFPKGSFVATWPDIETAIAAAFCLGDSRDVVVPVYVIVPEPTGI